MEDLLSGKKWLVVGGVITALSSVLLFPTSLLSHATSVVSRLFSMLLSPVSRTEELTQCFSKCVSRHIGVSRKICKCVASFLRNNKMFLK